MRLLKKVKRNLNSDANIALKKWNTKTKIQKTSKKIIKHYNTTT